jgi:exopolysaccharide production protein ExoZ
MSTTRQSDRLIALQALRAFAAGAVVFDHGQLTYLQKVNPHLHISVGIIGRLGVPVFFIISGFIIWASSSRLRGNAQQRTSTFVRRRLIRIVPMYWIATSIYAAKLAAQGNAPHLSDYVRSLFFVPYSNHGLMEPVLGQGWTLNYEMLFYAMLSIALVMVVRARLGWIFGTLITLMVLRATGVLTPHGAWAIWALAKPILSFFLLGVIFAIVWERVQDHRLTVPLWAVTLIGIAIILVYGGLSHFKVVTGPTSTGPQLVVCGALVAICVFFRVPHNEGRIGRAVVLAGDGSYSTYLIHGFILGPAGRVLSKLGIGSSVTPKEFSIVLILVCTAVGMLVYTFVENPMRNWLNARWGQAAGPRKSELPAAALDRA